VLAFSHASVEVCHSFKYVVDKITIPLDYSEYENILRFRWLFRCTAIDIMYI
jgi:hypothetical protein